MPTTPTRYLRADATTTSRLHGFIAARSSQTDKLLVMALVLGFEKLDTIADFAGLSPKRARDKNYLGRLEELGWAVRFGERGDPRWGPSPELLELLGLPLQAEEVRATRPGRRVTTAS